MPKEPLKRNYTTTSGSGTGNTVDIKVDKKPTDIDELTEEIRCVDLAVSDQLADMKQQMYLQSAVQFAILLMLGLIFIALISL